MRPEEVTAASVRGCGETPTPAFYEERIRHLEAERREIEKNAESWNLERIALVAERQQAIDALRGMSELAEEAIGYAPEWAVTKWQMWERFATLVKLGEDKP